MDRQTVPFPLIRIRIEDHKIVVLGTEGIDQFAQESGTVPNLLGLTPDQLSGMHLHTFLHHIVAASRPSGMENLEVGHQCFPTFCKVTEVEANGTLGIQAAAYWKSQGVSHPELSVFFTPKMQKGSARLTVKLANGFKCRWCQDYFLLEEGEKPGQLDSCEIDSEIVQRARLELMEEVREVVRQELLLEMAAQPAATSDPSDITTGGPEAQEATVLTDDDVVETANAAPARVTKRRKNGHEEPAEVADTVLVTTS